ncbi:F-actin-monooxygenase MICAL2 isoform X2 [Bufo gargarizans]|uniref:F-actin-monooxygenase MICAL2 isoform X2 n=1 Tax=Bufo gargarizans TaxID=30331 RepID=UPI001CF1BB6A|nr:F-actin-monooxygenase MICAL2 isoform X2 [Bufo gargarizans]
MVHSKTAMEAGGWLFSYESRFCLRCYDSQRLSWRPRGQCHEEAFTREPYTSVCTAVSGTILLPCLIIGGGPCGLRTAIELACLGAKVVVVEKRDTFSRNNVLHLWPYTIHDLRCLGAKKFYGKFCAGAIDHISIWQLQLMLFKIALLHGIEIHVNVEFVKLLEPAEDQENLKIGWRAEYLPQDHPLSDYEFDVIIGADGRRNTLEGFKRKEFRGKLAIAITANFINRNTTAEAKVEEISGVAFIFNQKFFQDLKEETGIDLENIVYYKDSTHYFVMTAKKQSLLDKGVILNDYADAEMLLCAENVDQESLQSYAREAADFATNYQLPSLDFAINHYGQPDVAMFDFTSMYASENAALVRERHGHHLLVALVGDSLLEPFWPMGTGCARGFLAAFDTAWMVRSWSQGTPPLEILAERESIYRLLPQTKPENISKNFDQYTIDPATRYPNLNSNCVRTLQVKHLYFTGELHGCPLERASSIRRSVGLSRHESDIRPNKLLTWCQKQTEGYRNVSVTDLTSSWKSGLALCAIIHHFRPDLIDFHSLNEDDAVRNNQLAFDIAEKEFGISPITTGREMASTEEPDKLSMVLYLSKFYELFRGAPLRPIESSPKDNGKNGKANASKPSSLLSNNYLNLTLPRKRVPKGENKSEENDVNKRRRRTMQLFDESGNFSSESINSVTECSDTKEVINQNKVKSMATQLLAKFEENAPNSSLRRQFQAVARSQQLARHLPTLPATAAVTRETARPAPAAVTRETHSREETASPPSPAESEDSLTTSYPSILALSGILERLQHIEERAQQRRAQALAIRDFHKKNIKEKAAHLASMFESPNFLQSKLVSDSPSHCSSELPLYKSHVSGRSAPPSPSISDHAHCDFPSEKIKPPSSGVSYNPFASPVPSFSDLSPSSPSDSQLKKVVEHRASSGEPRIKQRLFFPDPEQMTVGNVSSRIGAVAEVLVNLYMSDHKSKTRSPELTSLEGAVTELLDDSSSSPSSPSSVSPLHKGSLRKEFPSNIGGSDTCYFCKKRVYVVERLSAEGHFFHRECFKCSFCSSVLRLGNYVFNVEEGKFYCQPHFMHSFSSSKQRKRRTDSKAQDPDKTWKKEEAITAEVTTDSPCSAGSSSEDSSPDEPSSPKKSRSDSFFKIFKRRSSSVSTEWKSVRIGPEEETADNNLLAVRVMVLSDESSSDAENRPEENPGKTHRRKLSSRKKKKESAPLGTSASHREAQGDSAHPSKATDALVRTSNIPAVTANKSQRWRQKIQSTFPLLIAKRLSHVSRDGSCSPDDEVFTKNTSEHFSEPHIPSLKEPEEDDHPIPSYIPHHKVLLNNSTALKHGEQGSLATLTPASSHRHSYQKNKLDGYRDVDIGNDLLSGNLSDHSDVFENDEKRDEVSKQDKSIQEEEKPQNPTLKKLVLSNEEKSKLLDWSSTKPRPAVKAVKEQTLSHVHHDPGGEPESKGKSAFAILSNAIKRSFTRSSSSAPDSPKNITSDKSKPVSATSYLDIPGSFFGRSHSNLESYINPNDTEMGFMSSPHHDFKGSTDPSSSNIGFGSSQKPKQDSSKVEDMPKMLEKFSIRENQPSSAITDLPFRNRKGSIFSSLRLTNKNSQNPLNAPSNDFWHVPWTFRRKANEKEVEQKPRASSIAASNFQIMTQRDVNDVRGTKSENYSSSSDEESTRGRSASFKSVPASRQQRRMEKEARLRAKQEELKRLHKAQTIQRQLQETEEKHRALDTQGIKLEKALRGETDSAAQDEARLLRDWFQLALEKSKLNRYESELLSVARELELEDQQGRLEQKYREKMMIDPAHKDKKDIAEEEEIFAEMMRVIEQRDQLVMRIDEQRLRDNLEEKNLQDFPLPKDFELKTTNLNSRRFI